MARGKLLSKFRKVKKWKLSNCACSSDECKGMMIKYGKDWLCDFHFKEVSHIANKLRRVQ